MCLGHMHILASCSAYGRGDLIEQRMKNACQQVAGTCRRALVVGSEHGC